MSSSSPAEEQPSGAGRLLVDEPAPGVARLTISNPERRGALDHAILDAFAATMPGLDARCVIITGQGDTFSAGYDLAGLPDEVLPEEADRLVANPFAAAIDAVEAYPYPTVAALNGHTIGGGLELALACDLRIAAGTIALGMPRRSSAWSTPTPGSVSSSTRSARLARASCSWSDGGSMPARRARGGSSTPSPSTTASPRRRSSWRSRSPQTPRLPSAATST